MATREKNWDWDDSDNFQDNNWNQRSNISNRTTTYYCSKSSCYEKVSSSEEYCTYHQREQERERYREQERRKKQEEDLEWERRERESYERKEREFRLLEQEQKEREAMRIMEEQQRREIEERQRLETIQREHEQRLIEIQREAERELESLHAKQTRELQELQKEFDKSRLEIEKQTKELKEELKRLARCDDDLTASQQHNVCVVSDCQNTIDLGCDYCYNHTNECQESGCSARILGNQNYCFSHKKQTISDWRKEGEITDEEMSKLSEFNLNDEYALKQLKEILEESVCVNDSPIIPNTITEYSDFQTIIHDNLSSSLKRVRPRLAQVVAGGKPPEPPIEVIPFSTWFNANCATIISTLNWTRLFDVWVAVRENPIRKMEGFVDIIWVSEHSNRNEAREKAVVVREEMNGESPALCIAPSLQVFYNNSDYLFVNVVKVDLPINENIFRNPNEYLLPLDIVERSGGSYRHAAIYLGQDSNYRNEDERRHKVCHIFADGPSSSGSSAISVSSSIGTTASGSFSGSGTLSSASASEKKKAKTRIDTWKKFLSKNPKELIRYRITIPFKKYEKEIEQIAKAVVVEFGKGNYHLMDKNCEHFAFNISCGVNFSEQEQANRDKWYRKFLYRRGSKIERIDLEEEINKSNNLFDNLVSGKINLSKIEDSTTSKEVVEEFKRVEKWSKDRNLFETLQEAKIEVRVIVPPKYHNWK